MSEEKIKKRCAEMADLGVYGMYEKAKTCTEMKRLRNDISEKKKVLNIAYDLQSFHEKKAGLLFSAGEDTKKEAAESIKKTNAFIDKKEEEIQAMEAEAEAWAYMATVEAFDKYLSLHMKSGDDDEEQLQDWFHSLVMLCNDAQSLDIWNYICAQTWSITSDSFW